MLIQLFSHPSSIVNILHRQHLPMAYKPSICTMSLGRCLAGHSLTHKLDMARKHGFLETPVIRFAYEALCWETQVDTWEASWGVVCKIDRSNVGICLDTFNMAGRIYADPTALNGYVPDAHQALAESLDRLRSVPTDKVFLLQVADGERLERLLLQGHEFYNPEQPARMSWSRNARLFYGEAHHGNYLAIRDILQDLVSQIAFKGWISPEVFNRRLADDGQSVPEKWEGGQLNHGTT